VAVYLQMINRLSRVGVAASYLGLNFRLVRPVSRCKFCRWSHCESDSRWSARRK